MQRIGSLTAGLALAVALALGPGVVLAHGGSSVTVKPTSARPGETIAIQGESIGGTATIKLVGMGKETLIGTAKAGSDDDLSAEVALPKTLAPGSYQLKVQGKEGADTDFTVLPLASAGGEAEQPARTAAGSPAAGQADEMAANGVLPGRSEAMSAAPEVPLRERSYTETAGLVAIFGLLAGLGLFFARTARERRGSAAATAGAASFPETAAPAAG